MSKVIAFVIVSLAAILGGCVQPLTRLWWSAPVVSLRAAVARVLIREALKSGRLRRFEEVQDIYKAFRWYQELTGEMRLSKDGQRILLAGPCIEGVWHSWTASDRECIEWCARAYARLRKEYRVGRQRAHGMQTARG